MNRSRGRYYVDLCFNQQHPKLWAVTLNFLVFIPMKMQNHPALYPSRQYKLPPTNTHAQPNNTKQM